jgi:AcrR family transcriptional regulator
MSGAEDVGVRRVRRRKARQRETACMSAIRMISERGYEATTLRDIAKDAHVSVGLLYRYFPSKQAVIIALYDELSGDFASSCGGCSTRRRNSAQRTRSSD